MRHLVVVLALACGPKIPGADTPASSTDLGVAADEVLTELPAWEGFRRFDSPPRIVVLTTENQTKFNFDTDLATAKLVNGLVRNARGRFEVVDPQTWSEQRAAAAKAAKANPDATAPEPSPDDGDLLLLHSQVQATPTEAGGRAAMHVLVTYRLVDEQTAKALWAWNTEWAKAKGEAGFEVVEPARGPAPAMPDLAPTEPTGDAAADVEIPIVPRLPPRETAESE